MHGLGKPCPSQFAPGNSYCFDSFQLKRKTLRSTVWKVRLITLARQ
jgi:hypothetical protein